MSIRKEIHINDYRPLPYTCRHVEIFFDLSASCTTVSTKLLIEKVGEHQEPCVLFGEELALKSIYIDGKALLKDQYAIDDNELVLKNIPERFTLETVVEISPEKNTSLSGLYVSKGMLCTQNEPQGFRRITYFFDRPDCLCTYKVTLKADRKTYPILLANGNEIQRHTLPGGEHQVVWEDPFPKPCYLFAIVAGDLVEQKSEYVTLSGKRKELRIYCDSGNEEKCSFALESLQRAMRWDEEVYKREYDLDLFMIVAADAFNFGAMENKGLNIFNSACVLVDPKVTTDETFRRVEAIVAHEYFHNWTGNRITLRDWFQLTLKEGLTVFREQEFCSDMHDETVQRIHDVQFLRTQQFPEDAGPTSHPIRPSAYIEVDNFYTPTVYEKGAEVIRMCKTLLGKEHFAKAMQEYFSRYDGKALTCEEFLFIMEEMGQRDLSQFSIWYSQSGTPHVQVEKSWDLSTKTLRVQITQQTAQTADQKEKQPLQFPFALELFSHEGEVLSAKTLDAKRQGNSFVLEVKDRVQTFTFRDVEKEPVLSMNRGFCAPVTLQDGYTDEELAMLVKSDTDMFNRWDALQTFATKILLEAVEAKKQASTYVFSELFFETWGAVLQRDDLSFAFQAELLDLPLEEVVLQQQAEMAIDDTYEVMEALKKELGTRFSSSLWALYCELHRMESGEVNSEAFSRRRLKNLALGYWVRSLDVEALDVAFDQFKGAQTMSDELSALQLIVSYDEQRRGTALEHFYSRWHEEPLAMLKWFSIQSSCRKVDPLPIVKKLLSHEKYQERIPNQVRALVGSFVTNLPHFHRADGEGYRFVTEQILHMDEVNPFVAASLAGGFKKIQRMEEGRRHMMRESLAVIAEKPGISPNVYEIVHKCLGRS